MLAIMQLFFLLLKKQKNCEIIVIFFVLIKYQYKITQYNTLNVILSNSQLNKLKSEIKNGTEVILTLSSNVVDDSNNANNFPHKLLSNNTQVLRFRKAFGNGSPANVKLSKTHLHKIGQSGGSLGRLLGPLRKSGLPLMKNVIKPLVLMVFISIGINSSRSSNECSYS